MKNVIFRYEDTNYEFKNIYGVNYPYNTGAQYYGENHTNSKYSVINRDLPSTDLSFEVSGIKKTDRDNIWDLWNYTLQRGNKLFTIIDNKKRILFDVLWAQWKEQWQKARGGVHKVVMDIASAFPWTPPLFAFYPFNSYNVNGSGDHTEIDGDTNHFTTGSTGVISSDKLILSEGAYPIYGGYAEINWYQQKNNSSVSLIAQFRTGELVQEAEIEIIKIVSGNNILKLYIKKSSGESSSVGLSSSSSSAGISSSSMGLSSSTSAGISSSSSIGLSSSAGLSSSSANLSSSSANLSSSSANLSSSSVGLSSSGLMSSTSQGLSSSSSAGLSSSSSANLSSSSVNLSSSSANLSSSQNLSSSSAGLSSSEELYQEKDSSGDMWMNYDVSGDALQEIGSDIEE